MNNDNSSGISKNQKTEILDRRTFLRSAAVLIGGLYVSPSFSIESSNSASNFPAGEMDYLCCMQLQYMMSTDARLRRETNELYGNLDRKEYRKKLADEYYIPSSRIEVSGNSHVLSHEFADELVRRSGSIEAEKPVTEMLGFVTMRTSFPSLNIMLTGTRKGKVKAPKLSMEEQNTLVQVMWKMAFNPKLSSKVMSTLGTSEKRSF